MFKDPITDPGKKSKAGNLTLVQTQGEYKTVKIEDIQPDEVQMKFNAKKAPFHLLRIYSVSSSRLISWRRSLKTAKLWENIPSERYGIVPMPLSSPECQLSLVSRTCVQLTKYMRNMMYDAFKFSNEYDIVLFVPDRIQKAALKSILLFWQITLLLLLE